MKLSRPLRILSLSRAEAWRAEPHGGIRTGLELAPRLSADYGKAVHFQPGKVEIMLMTGMK